MIERQQQIILPTAMNQMIERQYQLITLGQRRPLAANPYFNCAA